MKKARKEGTRVANIVKSSKTEFYVASVDLDDDYKNMNTAMSTLVKTMGKHKASVALISGGDEYLSVQVHVPDELSDRITVEEWLEEIEKVMTGDKVEEVGEEQIVYKTEFPFKQIDTVRSNALAVLYKTGCLEEDESSEEFYGFDDI